MFDYEDTENNTLCFKHAVKKAIEQNEDITTHIDEDDPDNTSWFPFCNECSKEYLEKD